MVGYIMHLQPCITVAEPQGQRLSRGQCTINWLVTEDNNFFLSNVLPLFFNSPPPPNFSPNPL